MIVCPSCGSFLVRTFRNSGSSSHFCRCAKLSFSTFTFSQADQWVFRTGPYGSGPGLTLLLRDEGLRKADPEVTGWSEVLGPKESEAVIAQAVDASLASDVLEV